LPAGVGDGVGVLTCVWEFTAAGWEELQPAANSKATEIANSNFFPPKADIGFFMFCS